MKYQLLPDRTPSHCDSNTHIIQAESTSVSSKAKPESHSHHHSSSAKPYATVDWQPSQLIRVDIVGFWPFGDDLRRLVEDVGRQYHDCFDVSDKREPGQRLGPCQRIYGTPYYTNCSGSDEGAAREQRRPVVVRGSPANGSRQKTARCFHAVNGR